MLTCLCTRMHEVNITMSVCICVCVQIKHGDPSTVTTTGNPFWPRVLIEGSEDRDGDGEADPFMECTDPIGKSCYILLTRRMRTIHVNTSTRVRIHLDPHRANLDDACTC